MQTVQVCLRWMHVRGQLTCLSGGLDGLDSQSREPHKNNIWRALSLLRLARFRPTCAKISRVPIPRCCLLELLQVPVIKSRDEARRAAPLVSSLSQRSAPGETAFASPKFAPPENHHSPKINYRTPPTRQTFAVHRRQPTIALAQSYS